MNVPFLTSSPFLSIQSCFSKKKEILLENFLFSVLSLEVEIENHQKVLHDMRFSMTASTTRHFIPVYLLKISNDNSIPNVPYIITWNLVEVGV